MSPGTGRFPILAVAAAAMPAAAMSTESAMLTFTTMPSESAMLAEPTMLVEPRMPMRKAVAPATMIPVIALLVESVSVVAVAHGPVANGLRHASGQGKPDPNQQQYGPRQYSAANHHRLHYL